jgi:hypothetical protein
VLTRNIKKPSATIKSLTDRLKESVSVVVCYLDTITLWFHYPPVHLATTILRSVGDPRKFRIDDCKDREGNVWGCHLTVHQPRVHTMRLLDRLQVKHKAKLSVFHIATDLITRTQTDADELGAPDGMLNRGLILRYRRQGPTHDEEHGVYANKKRTRKKRSNRDWLTYADHPCKITGDPCAHVELRFQRADACRRLGITRVRDLLNINPAELINQHLGLYPDSEKLAYELLVKAQREAVMEHRHRTSEWPLYDQYRSSLAARVRSLIKHGALDRMQVIKHRYPYRKLIRITDVVAVPNHLTWKRSPVQYVQRRFEKKYPMISMIPPTISSPST